MSDRPGITIKLKLGLNQINREGKMKWRISYVPDDFFRLVHGEFIIERDEDTGEFYLNLTGQDYSKLTNRTTDLTKFFDYIR
ncbi:MAG: hypothetical protein ACXADY_15065 [Candidatus Hodarchaeales archaeon]